MIRTSGEGRLSNFLLWQSAYSEILITPVLWPDFRERDLYLAVADYLSRERRFGKIKPQDCAHPTEDREGLLDASRWKRLLKGASVKAEAERPSAWSRFLRAGIMPRVLVTLLGVPCLYLITARGGIFFLLLVNLVVFLGLREFYVLMRAQGVPPLRIAWLLLAP